MEASGRLEGVALGPDGAPLADAEVVVARAPRETSRPWQDTGGRWTARTDRAGRFAVDELPGDRFVVEARTFAPQRWCQVEQEVAEGTTGEVRLALAPMATLRGRLLLPAQVETIVPIDLRLRGAGERVRPLHTRRHDGSFGCGWLPGGTYVVSVPEDWLPELAEALGVPRVIVRPVEVHVAEGRDAEVLLRLELP